MAASCDIGKDSDRTPLVPPALKRLCPVKSSPDTNDSGLVNANRSDSGHINLFEESSPRAARSTISGVVSQFNQLRHKRSALDKISSAFNGIFRRMCYHGERSLLLFEENEDASYSQAKETVSQEDQRTDVKHDVRPEQPTESFSNVSIGSLNESDREVETSQKYMVFSPEDKVESSVVKDVNQTRRMRWNLKRQRLTFSSKKCPELCLEDKELDNQTVEADLKGHVNIHLDKPGPNSCCDHQNDATRPEGGRLQNFLRGLRNLRTPKQKPHKALTSLGLVPCDDARSWSSTSSFSREGNNDRDPEDAASVESTVDLSWSPGGLRRRSSSYDILSVRGSADCHSFTDIQGLECTTYSLTNSSRMCFSAMATVGRQKSGSSPDVKYFSLSKSDNELESEPCAPMLMDRKSELGHRVHLCVSRENLAFNNS